MPSSNFDKRHSIRGRLSFVIDEPKINKNLRTSKRNYIFSVNICFIVLFCFVSLGFWLINYKYQPQPFRIYLLVQDDETMVAKIISVPEMLKIKLNKSFTSVPETTQVILEKYECSSVPKLEQFDCFPGGPVTEAQCLSRGCCYQSVPEFTAFEKNKNVIQPLGVPNCYFSINYIGYEIHSVTRTNLGLTANLEKRGSSGFPNDIRNLKLSVINIDEDTLRVKITDANENRFEPPIARNVAIRNIDIPNYEVALAPMDGILSIWRKSTRTILFNVNLHQLIYSNQFIQLSTKLASSNIYGLGERYEPFLKDVNWTRRSLFNRNNWPAKGVNLYGTHAFHVIIEKDTKSHGVFFLNSNAIDLLLQPAPALTYRTIGGILDFFIFLGPRPSNVIEQYTRIVGRPFMPPYWSLGFHLSRHGYLSLNDTIVVWNRTRSVGIPFDTQWNDIDHMDNYKTFTYNKINFSNLPEFVDKLHDLNMHYVVLINPGICNTEPTGTYPPYDEGLQDDLFIKDDNGKTFIGKLKNSLTAVYPDFTHPATEEYWYNQMKNLYNLTKYDGVWLNINEPTNFQDGNKCRTNLLDEPPYIPNSGNEPLRAQTLCMSAKHYNTTHYNEHNLYAYREAVATAKVLRRILDKRPFIISRASFAGLGAYSGHWSGDINSTWEDLRYSIINLLNFNIFGIPMVGSDICGYRNDTDMELCARWQAVGAFYPFSRNHNDLYQKDQDPAALGGIVLEATKATLKTRYAMLPYIYTLFHKSHINGEMVITSLAFKFPDDPNTYAIEEQFMMGSALMIMPALYKGVKEIKVYFPNVLWYDYYTGERFNANGKHMILPAPLNSINLAIRGGHIIPQQNTALTTADSRKNKFNLLIMMDENNYAIGALYWDDGESLDTYENELYNFIKFEVKYNKFMSDVVKSNYTTQMDLDKIKICTLDFNPTKVTINGTITKLHKFDNHKCLVVTVGLSLLINFEVQLH